MLNIYKCILHFGSSKSSASVHIDVALCYNVQWGRPSGVKSLYVLGWLCGDTKARVSRMFREAIVLWRLSDTSSRP